MHISISKLESIPVSSEKYEQNINQQIPNIEIGATKAKTRNQIIVNDPDCTDPLNSIGVRISKLISLQRYVYLMLEIPGKSDIRNLSS